MKLVEPTDEFKQPPRESNVIHLRMISYLPLDPDKLLGQAIGELDGVVILGYRKGDPENRNAGDEYFASSFADGGTVLWLLERCKHKLLHIADEDIQAGEANPEPA